MAKLSQFEVLSLYKRNMLSCIDEVLTIFPDDPDLVVARILLEDQIPIEESMRNFSSKIIPVREQILNHDDKFFLENNIIFQEIPGEKVLKWKKYWISGRLDSSDKLHMFKWFELFLKLSEMFVANEKIKITSK